MFGYKEYYIKLKFKNTTIQINLYSAVFNLIIPETFMIKYRTGNIYLTINRSLQNKRVKLKVKEPTLNIGQNQSLIKFFKFVLRQFE